MLLGKKRTFFRYRTLCAVRMVHYRGKVRFFFVSIHRRVCHWDNTQSRKDAFLSRCLFSQRENSENFETLLILLR